MSEKGPISPDQRLDLQIESFDTNQGLDEFNLFLESLGLVTLTPERSNQNRRILSFDLPSQEVREAIEAKLMEINEQVVASNLEKQPITIQSEGQMQNSERSGEQPQSSEQGSDQENSIEQGQPQVPTEATQNSAVGPERMPGYGTVYDISGSHNTIVINLGSGNVSDVGSAAPQPGTPAQQEAAVGTGQTNQVETTPTAAGETQEAQPGGEAATPDAAEPAAQAEQGAAAQPEGAAEGVGNAAPVANVEVQGVATTPEAYRNAFAAMVNEINRQNNERLEDLYGRGAVGRLRGWLFRKFEREVQENPEFETAGRIGQENPLVRPWLKTAAKIVGGAGIATAAIMGGAGFASLGLATKFVAPIAAMLGVKTAASGMIESAQNRFFGRTQRTAEIATAQQALQTAIERGRQTLREGQEFTRADAQQVWAEIQAANAALEAVDQANITGERHDRQVRRWGSTAAGLAFGFLGGVPIGVSDYDSAGAVALKKHLGNVAYEHGTVVKPLANLWNGQDILQSEYFYNSLMNESDKALEFAKATNNPLKEIHNFFGLATHSVGDNLKAAWDAKVGIAEAIAALFTYAAVEQTGEGDTRSIQERAEQATQRRTPESFLPGGDPTQQPPAPEQGGENQSANNETNATPEQTRIQQARDVMLNFWRRIPSAYAAIVVQLNRAQNEQVQTPVEDNTLTENQRRETDRMIEQIRQIMLNNPGAIETLLADLRQAQDRREAAQDDNNDDVNQARNNLPVGDGGAPNPNQPAPPQPSPLQPPQPQERPGFLTRIGNRLTRLFGFNNEDDNQNQ